jgi:hypothetical protein
MTIFESMTNPDPMTPEIFDELLFMIFPKEFTPISYWASKGLLSENDSMIKMTPNSIFKNLCFKSHF